MTIKVTTTGVIKTFSNVIKTQYSEQRKCLMITQDIDGQQHHTNVEDVKFVITEENLVAV